MDSINGNNILLTQATRFSRRSIMCDQLNMIIISNKNITRDKWADLIHSDLNNDVDKMQSTEVTCTL